MDLHTAKGRAMYECCVLTLNRSNLDVRTDTAWRGRLDVDSSVKPAWRVLYKPPLRKRTGDLQWRILHGAIAVNWLMMEMKITVKYNCPFCGEVETVFHAFYDCKILFYLFNTLQNVFKQFDEPWIKSAFILGVGVHPVQVGVIKLDIRRSKDVHLQQQEEQSRGQDRTRSSSCFYLIAQGQSLGRC